MSAEGSHRLSQDNCLRKNLISGLVELDLLKDGKTKFIAAGIWRAARYLFGMLALKWAGVSIRMCKPFMAVTKEEI